MPAAPADEKLPDAVREAARAVLAPLARLAVARGLPYAQLEALLKQAVVEAALAAHPDQPRHRSVSRVSAATGINRREVTRLTQAEAAPAPRRQRSIASEVYAHWATAREFRDRRGRPLVLPRSGPHPSFETLARAVTSDVHPRSLLEELLRLKLARLSDAGDAVVQQGEGFVPSGDERRMLQLLGDNVADHLEAAVGNVLGGGRRHFEQALFADGLSAASLAEVRALIGPLWKHLLGELVPPLETLVERDADGPGAHRVRIGLYAYDDEPAPPARREDSP
jgi:hypothetical protein